jgi:integrase
MKLSQFDGAAIEVVQEKTGTDVWSQVHQRLRKHLQGHTGHLVLCLGAPIHAPESLTTHCSNVQGARFPGYSPHGLRHLAGSALAEAGCSVHEIMSVLGHRTEAQAIEYVKQANRKIMATSAIAKWEHQRNRTD